MEISRIKKHILQGGALIHKNIKEVPFGLRRVRSAWWELL